MFQFQTGSIRSIQTFGSGRIGVNMFQFQTGSIRRLSKININIILHPYSSCQVNFYFDQIRGQFAVDLQSCKFSGRLTALCVKRVYRQYYAKFGKLSSTKLVNFRRSTADRPNRFCWTAYLKQVRYGIRMRDCLTVQYRFLCYYRKLLLHSPLRSVFA